MKNNNNYFVRDDELVPSSTLSEVKKRTPDVISDGQVFA